MKDLLKVFAFLMRSARELGLPRGLFFVALFASILSGAASVGFLKIINDALEVPDSRGDLVWIFIALCIALPVFRFTSRAVLLRLVERMLFKLRLELSRRVLAAPLRELEKIGPSRLLATLAEDTEAIVAVLSNLPIMALQLTIVLGCLGYLYVLSPYLLAWVLLFMVVGIAGYQFPVVSAQRYLRSMRASWDELFNAIRALVEGGKELKMNEGRREEFFERDLTRSARKVQDFSVTGGTIYAAVNSWGQVLFFVVIGGILFAVPTMRNFDSEITTGFILALLYMMTPLEGLMALLPIIGRAVVSAQKVEALGLSLTDHPQDIGHRGGVPATSLATSLKVAPGWKTLSLVGVSHNYPGEVDGETFTLGPLDLTFRPGELIFLTGGNGSGKTTLAKLLIGLYAPLDGEVQLDGLAIDDGARDAYRQLFSVVFADFYLFENLLGLGTEEDADAKARQYLERLQLHRKVKVEDGKLSTVELSQGQRKRLALLAAYLEDRPIYLFDEWAADQDPLFKKVFYHQLLPELKARGKTVFVVSHDDGYFSVADRLIKLDFGQVTSDQISKSPGN